MLTEFNDRLDDLLPLLLELKAIGNNTVKSMIKKIKKEYLKGKNYVGRKNAQGFMNVRQKAEIHF